MRFPGNLPRVLAYVAMSFIVVALLGAEILAGETGRRENGLSDNLRHDRSPRFVVELELPEIGIHAFFTEVSGLGSENTVAEYRDGNDPNVVHKLPGPLTWPNIVLKRGVSSDSSLWQWRKQVETGNLADARTNGKLTLLDRGVAVASWQFVNGWPAKISGPTLNGNGNDIAIEEIEIAHEGMMRD